MADILVVEDDTELRELLAETLRSVGHVVREAADGEAGLRALAGGFPDLVILDVEMPALDGPAMAYRMFVEDCGMENIPILLSSGCIDFAEVSLRVGTPYCLAKPYSPQELMALIGRALAERHPPVRQRGG
jgi:CheY-like chemotaxis protein